MTLTVSSMLYTMLCWYTMPLYFVVAWLFGLSEWPSGLGDSSTLHTLACLSVTCPPVLHAVVEVHSGVVRSLGLVFCSPIAVSSLLRCLGAVWINLI